MDPPRLLAVGDVHLTAPFGATESVRHFYEELLGFAFVPDQDPTQRITFVGVPRSGPRLVFDLVEVPPAKPMRRQALVQFGSLTPIAQALTDQGIAFEWSSGWFFFDRRIGLLDPSGNWIELTSSHSW